MVLQDVRGPIHATPQRAEAPSQAASHHLSRPQGPELPAGDGSLLVFDISIDSQ
jgi:hypothetical protein